jgi:predicted nucleic acid-binding protein
VSLPLDGVVYVDAQILIYSVEAHEQYGAALRPFWAAAADGRVRVCTSELSRLEVSVRPRRDGLDGLLAEYLELLDGTQLDLLPVTRLVLDTGAELRAAHQGLRTPDAIHAATALVHGCAAFLSNDAGFRQVGGLSVVLLGRVVAGSTW